MHFSLALFSFSSAVPVNNDAPKGALECMDQAKKHIHALLPDSADAIITEFETMVQQGDLSKDKIKDTVWDAVQQRLKKLSWFAYPSEVIRVSSKVPSVVNDLNTCVPILEKIEPIIACVKDFASQVAKAIEENPDGPEKHLLLQIKDTIHTDQLDDFMEDPIKTIKSLEEKLEESGETGEIWLQNIKECGV